MLLQLSQLALFLAYRSVEVRPTPPDSTLHIAILLRRNCMLPAVSEAKMGDPFYNSASIDVDGKSWIDGSVIRIIFRGWSAIALEVGVAFCEYRLPRPASETISGPYFIALFLLWSLKITWTVA